MVSVRIVSSSEVQASRNEKPNREIELTVCDVKFLHVGPIQKGLLFLKPESDKGKEWNETFVQHLKTSLSSTLDLFTPLAGRLATVEHDDNTVTLFIDCNNTGVPFVHAVADDVSVADILEPVYVPPVIHSFFTLNGVVNREGISKPLIGFQVTELVDGIFIGCTLNHSVGDGTTFWNFFNCWSAISRGLDKISNPPVIERWLYFSDNFSPARIPLSCFKPVATEYVPPPAFQVRVFHFTKKSIAGLKAKANAEAGTNNISSLQSVLAHIWRAVSRCRRYEPEEEIAFFIHVGLRQRLKQPELPDKYFGNAVLGAIVTCQAGEIQEENGLGYAALQMNKVVASHSEDNLQSTLRSFAENPRIPLLMDGLNNALGASSSPRFNMYGNDFGWGRPVAVRSGSGNLLDGKITVFPGAEEGSMDIEVCVLPESHQALGMDSEFMNAFNV